MAGDAEWASGLVIGGCELHELIGTGGNGFVYRATQTAIGRDVAVKISTAASTDPAHLARFRREAKMAGALEHTHSLPVYAAGEEDGLLYLVMPLIDGPDLGKLLARDGPLPPERAVALIGELAGALDTAHAAGLVHRDVKPANVLIDERHAGRAYLSDFGLMRPGTTSEPITLSGQWLGTADYMSPEQCEGRSADARSDIYALTGVLYAALSGRRPYERDSVAQTAQAHLTDPPPSLGRPDSATIDAVLAKGMAKDPADRYQSATALAQAARAALLGANAKPSPVGAVGSRSPDEAPTVALQIRGRRRRRPRALVFGGPIVAILVVAVAVAAALGSFSSRSVSPTQPTTEPTPPPTYATHSGAAYSFTYPYGWTFQADGLNLGAFRRTQLQSSRGDAELIIDRTPGDARSPSAHAAQAIVPPLTSQTGYRLVASNAIELDAQPAWIWEFTLAGQTNPDRVDVFISRSGSGYGVLAEANSLAAARNLALTVARSITPR